jgi:hypothetical protein
MLKQSFLCPCEWNEARLCERIHLFFFFFVFFLLRRSCRHGRRKQKRPKGFRACSRLPLSMVCLCALPENFPSVFVYYHFTCVFVLLLLLLLLLRTTRWNEIQRLFFFFFLSELLHAWLDHVRFALEGLIVFFLFFFSSFYFSRGTKRRETVWKREMRISLSHRRLCVYTLSRPSSSFILYPPSTARRAIWLESSLSSYSSIIHRCRTGPSLYLSFSLYCRDRIRIPFFYLPITALGSESLSGHWYTST